MRNMGESPGEKLWRKGAMALTDSELLQIIVGRGGNAPESARIGKSLDCAIKEIGVHEMTVEYASSVKGIGEARSAAVMAALEYGRRNYSKKLSTLIDSPEAAARQFDFIRNKKQEHLVLLTMDGARRLINKRVISIGTLMSSLVHPREVFNPAIEDRAASIIIGHNHPSGDLSISEQDREVSRDIKQAGELLGIPLDDHIVIVSDGFASAM